MVYKRLDNLQVRSFSNRFSEMLSENVSRSQYEEVQDYVSTVRYTSNIAVGGPGGNPYSLITTYP